MNVRLPFRSLLLIALALLAAQASNLSGQSPSAALIIIAREPHRAVPITNVGGQDLIALDDLATSFQAAFREENGALTISYKGRTVALTPDSTLASVAGRVVSLPAAPTRVTGRWMVPLDFISRALAGIYDTRIELRRGSRLVILGDMRVPRLTLRQDATAAGARIAIDFMPRANATVTRDQPDRVVVRIDADALDVAWPGPQVPGFVQGYRAVDANTIAIDLGPRVGAMRSALQVADASNTLIIDLLPQEGSAPAATPAEPATPAAPAPAELPALSAGGSGARAIVIDAGHGGDDRGAVGPTGIAEKNVTLALARRLKSALESRLGVRVLLTREDDRTLAVSDRPAVANNNKASLFISLHANGSPRPSASGATIYLASFEDADSDVGRTASDRLLVYGGGLRDIELVPWNLAQARYRDQSALFAALVAETFKDRIALSPISVDRAPLRVLESANMPALLIETGFLTNPEQEKLLTNPDHQALIADAIVDAIVRFRAGATPEPRP